MNSETPKTSLEAWRLRGRFSPGDLVWAGILALALAAALAAFLWGTYLQQQMIWQLSGAYTVTLVLFGLHRWWTSRQR